MIIGEKYEKKNEMNGYILRYGGLKTAEKVKFKYNHTSVSMLEPSSVVLEGTTHDGESSSTDGKASF